MDWKWLPWEAFKTCLDKPLAALSDLTAGTALSRRLDQRSAKVLSNLNHPMILRKKCTRTSKIQHKSFWSTNYYLQGT